MNKSGEENYGLKLFAGVPEIGLVLRENIYWGEMLDSALRHIITNAALLTLHC
jgi:hypothetical protein